MSTLPRARQEAQTGPVDDSRALARCVAEPDGFPAAWGMRPLLSTAAELPRPFDDLLDLDAIDELLSRRGLRTPFLRLAKDGEVVDSARFTRSGGVGAAIGDQVDDTAVTRLFADGTTIVLQALHRLWPPVIDFAGALTGELGHPMQVNAYVTPPSSRGFSAHYDVHDVFVLQLAGEKRWIVHDPVHAWPLRTQPWTKRRAAVERAVMGSAPVLDAVLKPGDALYLPRGFLHAAEALGAVSAHLTVGIHVVTRYALVEALLAEAAELPELRRALPVGLDLTDAEALDDELGETIAALVSGLRDVRPAAVAARLHETLAGAMRPSPIAPLAQIAASERVDSETRIALRDGLEVGLDVSNGAATLRHPGGAVEIDAGAGAAVAALLEGGVRTVGSLPGEEATVLALVRRLLVDGIVVPAAEPDTP
jgi:bifunctional lysine-specific demethylase and histidyl-hydroxylase NO66